MVNYQFEYSERLRAAFIGAGGHSYRNIYPAFQYAPVELVAVCDLDEHRAEAYARLFGGGTHYTDYREMLAREEIEAVFIVTAYDEITGRVQATDIAQECLAAGMNVWMEKPVASSVAEVESLKRSASDAGRFVAVGLKTIFTPVFEKIEAIVSNDEFGDVSSISIRYPQALPTPDQRHDLVAMRGFLDHIYHPAAILTRLLGPVRQLSYEWEPTTGSSVANLRFGAGAIGTLHLAAGIAHSSPLERLEVVGRDANIVVENGVRVTYYRPGAYRAYGRTASFLVDDAVAPLSWEPEFSLGQLYNKNLFYLGYAPEVVHFSTRVLSGVPPTKGTLDDALAIMHIFEAYQHGSAGTTITLPSIT